MTDAEFDQHMARYAARQARHLADLYGGGPAPIPAPPGGALSVVYAHTPYGAWLRYDVRSGWSPLPPGTLPPVDEQMRPFSRPEANHPAAPSLAEYRRATPSSDQYA